MGMVFTASVSILDSGDVTCAIYDTDEWAARGGLRTNTRWTAVPADDYAGSADETVGVALACASLGSRLLRLASDIHAQIPLFTVRDLGGVG